MRYITTLTSTTDLNTYMDNQFENYFNYQGNKVWSTNDPGQFNNDIALFDENMINDFDNQFYYNLNLYQSKFSAIKLGDILYLDRNNEIYITDEILEKDEGYTPIAVCCIPSNFFFDGAPARFVSCYGYVSKINISSSNYSKIFDYVESNEWVQNTPQVVHIARLYNSLTYICSDKKIDTNIDNACTVNDSITTILTTKRITYPMQMSNINSVVSKNELITYKNLVLSNEDSYYIITYNDYSIQFNLIDNGLIIWDDFFGYLNTYKNIGINNDTYNNWKSQIIGANELGNKVYWYMPGITELIFLRMHIGIIKDICFNLQKEYNLYYYDMFQLNIDVTSSTLIFDNSQSPVQYIYYNINKYGILYPTQSQLNYYFTYPMFMI